MKGNERGAVTLEAMLVAPLVCALTFGCVLAGAAYAKQAVLYGELLAAAARAAFIWDNSYKQPMSGAFYPDQHDALYWRQFDDAPESALAQHKLLAATERLPDGIQAELEYRSVHRTIYIRSGRWDAVAAVAEPAEYIRSIDFARRFWPHVSRIVTAEQSDEIIRAFSARNGYDWPEKTFHSHNEARSYLRRIVHGQEAKRSTNQVGEWRLIDALDRYNVAHQAYYGLQTASKQVIEQALKDEELLRAGEISGVVWHFFRRSRDGSIGLSAPLRSQLEARGIVVVIHETIRALE